MLCDQWNVRASRNACLARQHGYLGTKRPAKYFARGQSFPKASSLCFREMASAGKTG
jgi:hypothetical protein